MKVKIVALSSPSGGGKTTICKVLLKKHENFKLSVSATTRSPRPEEVDGIDYYFFSKNEFLQKIDNDEFLEYENVHGNLYGTLKNEINKVSEKNVVLIFDVDVKGALNIKKKYPEAILIFIKPPTIEELEKRLKKRETESHEKISKRLERLELEFNAGKSFDHTVINDKFDDAIREVEKIVLGKK